MFAADGMRQDIIEKYAAAFDQTISTDPAAPSVLHAETIAQSAERGGGKVIQLEWAGGDVLGAVRRGHPDTGDRLDERATSYSPALKTRMRVLDGTTDKYGLNASDFDSRSDRRTKRRQGAVRPRQGRRGRGGHAAPGRARRRQGDDPGGALDGRTAGMPVKVETLDPDASRVRLVLQPGDRLLDVIIDDIAAHSPVGPLVEGRVVRG